MSGSRRPAGRPQLPLLDRLIDDEPGRAQEAAPSPAEALTALRRSVRQDIEALLNARRRWRSWPRRFAELNTSPLNFGIPDCTAGRFHDAQQRETLRREIEDTIRRFEPRFRSVRVALLANENKIEGTLRLRIDAMLQVDPAPEPIAFDTVLDPVTAEAFVRTADRV